MSEGRLEGKNVVVSGGAAGVGGAASEIFASEGALNFYLLPVSPQILELTTEPIGIEL